MNFKLGDILELNPETATGWAKERLKMGNKYTVNKISSVNSLFFVEHSGGFNEISFRLVGSIKKSIKINVV